VENSPFLPQSVYWLLLGFAATAVASISLQNLVWVSVAVFLIHHFKTRERIDWPKGLFPASTLFFLFTFFLAALMGVDPANSFHSVHKYLTFLLIFFLGAMALQFRNVQKLLLTFVYGAAFCALIGIGKHFFLHQDRIDSFSGDKMVFGGMLMVSLLLLVAFLKDSPKNTFLWISLLLVGIALVFTQTRGAWVGCLAGFLTLTWRLSRKWFWMGLLVLTASFFILPQPLQDRIKSIGDLHFSYDKNGQLENSTQERVLIWEAGLKIVQDYPWGVGQGNLPEIYPKYKLPGRQTRRFPIFTTIFYRYWRKMGGWDLPPICFGSSLITGRPWDGNPMT